MKKKVVVEVAVWLDCFTGMTFRFDRMTPDGRKQGKNRYPRHPERFIEPIISVHLQDFGGRWHCRPWYGGALGFALQNVEERRRSTSAQEKSKAAAR